MVFRRPAFSVTVANPKYFKPEVADFRFPDARRVSGSSASARQESASGAQESRFIALAKGQPELVEFSG